MLLYSIDVVLTLSNHITVLINFSAHSSSQMASQITTNVILANSMDVVLPFSKKYSVCGHTFHRQCHCKGPLCYSIFLYSYDSWFMNSQIKLCVVCVMIKLRKRLWYARRICCSRAFCIIHIIVFLITLMAEFHVLSLEVMITNKWFLITTMQISINSTCSLHSCW